MHTRIENGPVDRLITTSSHASQPKSLTRRQPRSQLDKAIGDLGDRLITLADVQAKTGLARATIYKKQAQDSAFPKPVKLGRASRWSMREIDAWLADQIAARDNAA